jgi:SAM-dependent methyltransferase
VPAASGRSVLPGADELAALFRQKYGEPERAGPSPRRRHQFGYSTPDDHYEALVNRLVTPGSRWLDVGGGRDVFPPNPALATELAGRCGRLVAVDPSPNVHENPFAHEKIEAFIEDYRADEPFDVLTLRMVAEHIARPDDAAAAMARLIKPGGRVVIYTINKWSPVPIVTWVTPFWMHHRIKRVVWGTDEKDTFPVAYKMNTRSALARVMGRHGFAEEAFAHLDDCRTFHQFNVLNYLELVGYRAARAVGLHYPETCLLGVYQRDPKSPA